ncbi:ATP-binding protein [Pedobacter sp. BS3]|uniref:ATP-binding protein n=1 Tax=Pedobacter sp. BS3 TaxID=2567937 RepID=UPI0018D90521|nr:ATP-binding protein [Pedobacter sp. BS3]
MQQVPAVAILGPRQVGKTTLVKQLIEGAPGDFIYLDLEDPADTIKLQDTGLFLTNNADKTIIIDEVQRMPELFPVLRSVIDKNRKPGRFILLGSASPELLKQSSESLAGRIRYQELYPFSLNEVGPEKLNSLWIKGGFPEAFLAQSDEDAMEWLSDFIYSYATRDLAQLGLAMPATQIIRLLQMLAHMHGQVINYSSLSRSLGVSQPTVTNAIYYLEQAMLVRTLKPWFSNSGKRLVKSSKIYIRDSGMLHNLLFLSGYNQVMGHPQAGNSWEGFVIQQILTILPKNIQPWFYRSQDGAETDLLLSKGNLVQCAVEIKLSNVPDIKRGNTQTIQDIQPRHSIVITPSSDSFTLKQTWQVTSISTFLNDIETWLA